VLLSRSQQAADRITWWPRWRSGQPHDDNRRARRPVARWRLGFPVTSLVCTPRRFPGSATDPMVVANGAGGD